MVEAGLLSDTPAIFISLHFFAVNPPVLVYYDLEGKFTMSEIDKTTLREELRKWDVEIKPDPHATQHVLNRIASEQFENRPARFTAKLVPFVLTTGIAAILVLGALFMLDQRSQTRLLQNHQYLALIDPVTRANLHEEGASGDRLLEQLSWMQNRLELSREQFLALVSLHQNYSETFNGLYDELIQMENEYEHFEQLRKNDKMVDFIALYDLLSERKETETLAHKLSQELIEKVASLLSPSQRNAYLSMVTSGQNPNA